MQKHNNTFTFSNIYMTFFLSICWILGLLIGLFLAICLPDESRYLVHTLVYSRVSTVGLLINLFLPIILSAIVWKLKFPALFLLFAFIKAISYGFCFYVITYIYHEAGWFLRWLFLFSDTVLSVLLLWFWFRNINAINKQGRKDVCICSILVLLISLLDIYYVSPFLQRLF